MVRAALEPWVVHLHHRRVLLQCMGEGRCVAVRGRHSQVQRAQAALQQEGGVRVQAAT